MTDQPLSSKAYHVEIPAPLKKFTGEGEIVIPYEDVREAIKRLKEGFLESIKTKTFDEFVQEVFGEELCT